MLPRLAFQQLNCVGTVLDVGGGTEDSAGLKAKGATTVDIRPGADICADARCLPFSTGSFDTVVLGDIIEHMIPSEGAVAIGEAIRVAKQIVIITAPEDTRTITEQQIRGQPSMANIGDMNIYSCYWHIHRVTREWLFDQLIQKGVTNIFYQIDTSDGNFLRYHLVCAIKSETCGVSICQITEG